MSATTETIQKKSVAPSFSLWLRQIAAIMRLEVKKNFFGKRAFLVYLLAFMPIGLLGMIAILPPAAREWLDFTAYPKLFSGMYSALILRTVIFFGCAWIFMNLFLGEIVDSSLHYYYFFSGLRDFLLVGTLVSGVVIWIVLF